MVRISNVSLSRALRPGMVRVRVRALARYTRVAYLRGVCVCVCVCVCVQRPIFKISTKKYIITDM